MWLCELGMLFLFLFRLLCGGCQHCSLQCGAMIGDLTLQTWKWCDWLRKYSGISVLCPRLSLCLDSSLNTLLGVPILQKPLQCWTCPFTFSCRPAETNASFYGLLGSNMFVPLLWQPITILVPTWVFWLLLLRISALCSIRRERGGCLCMEPLWGGSAPHGQGSIVLGSRWSTAASCLPSLIHYILCPQSSCSQLICVYPGFSPLPQCSLRAPTQVRDKKEDFLKNSALYHNEESHAFL